MAAVNDAGARKKIQTEQIAWGILLLSFALFCLTCLGTTVGIYLFLFESTQPLDAVVQVGRGTVILRDADFNEAGARSTTSINRLTTLSTDKEDQAALLFNINESDTGRDETLAMVTLHNESFVRYQSGTQPRFEWGSSGYYIDLRDAIGEFEVLVTAAGNDDVFMQIVTQHGATIDIAQPGRYSLFASEDVVRLTTRHGAALLGDTTGQDNYRLVSAGEGGIVVGNRPAVTSTNLARVSLLENSLFAFDLPVDLAMRDAESVIPLPERWGCTNVIDAAPRGQYLPLKWNGYTVLRLLRGAGADTNGQTRCRQTFPGDGLSIPPDYTYLELETTFYINYQSLSKCGVDGSECPVMLRIDYTDIDGNEQVWLQGMYYAEDPAYELWPSRCSTCFYGEHRRINEKAWYTFRSGNLMRILSSRGVPASINQVEFYASGHQYDVLVSEMALYGGLADTTPRSDSETVSAP